MKKLNKLNSFKNLNLFLTPILAFGALSTVIVLTSCNKTNNNKTNKQNALDSILALNQTVVYQYFSTSSLEYIAYILLQEDVDNEDVNEKGTLYNLCSYLTSSSGFGLTDCITPSSSFAELIKLASVNGSLRTNKNLPNDNDAKWLELLKRVGEFGKKILKTQLEDGTILFYGFFNSQYFNTLPSSLEYGDLKLGTSDFDFITSDLDLKIIDDFSKLTNGVSFAEGFSPTVGTDTTFKALTDTIYDIRFYENESIISSNKSNELLTLAIDYTSLTTLLQENRNNYENAQSIAYELSNYGFFSSSKISDVPTYEENDSFIISNLVNSCIDIDPSIQGVDILNSKVEEFYVNFSTESGKFFLKSHSTSTKQWEKLTNTLFEFKSHFDICIAKSCFLLDANLFFSILQSSNSIGSLLDTNWTNSVTNRAAEEFLYIFNGIAQTNYSPSSSFSQVFLKVSNWNPEFFLKKGSIEEWIKLDYSFKKLMSFNFISLIYTILNIDRSEKLTVLLNEVENGFLNLEKDVNDLIPNSINEESTLQDLYNLILQEKGLVVVNSYEEKENGEKWNNLFKTLYSLLNYFANVSYNIVDANTVIANGSTYIEDTSVITITLPFTITDLSNSHLTTNDISVSVNNIPLSFSLSTISTESITINLTGSQSNLWKEGDEAIIKIGDIKINNNFYRFNIAPVALHKAPTTATISATSNSSASTMDTSMVTLTLNNPLTELEKQDFKGKIHLNNQTAEKQILYNTDSLIISGSSSSLTINIPVESTIENPQWKENDSVIVSIDTIYKNNIKYTFTTSSAITFHKVSQYMVPTVSSNGKADETTTSLITIDFPRTIPGLTPSIIIDKISLSNSTNSGLTPSFAISSVKENQIVLSLTNQVWNEGDNCTITFSSFESNRVSYSLPAVNVKLHKAPTHRTFTITSNGTKDTETSTTISITLDSNIENLSSISFTDKVEIKNERTKNLLSVSGFTFTNTNVINATLSNPSQWQEGDIVSVNIKNVKYSNISYSFSFVNTAPIILHKQATAITFTATSNGTSATANTSMITLMLSVDPSTLPVLTPQEMKIHISNTSNSNSPISIDESKTVIYDEGKKMNIYLKNNNEWNNGDAVCVSIDNLTKDGITYSFSSVSVNLYKNNNVQFTAVGNGKTNAITDTELKITLANAISDLQQNDLHIEVRKAKNNEKINTTFKSLTSNKEIVLNLTEPSSWKEGDEIIVKIESFTKSSNTYTFNEVHTYLHKAPTVLTLDVIGIIGSETGNPQVTGNTTSVITFTISPSIPNVHTQFTWSKIKSKSLTTNESLYFYYFENWYGDNAFKGLLGNDNFYDGEQFEIWIEDFEIDGVLYTIQSHPILTMKKGENFVQSHASCDGETGVSNTTSIKITFSPIKLTGVDISLLQGKYSIKNKRTNTELSSVVSEVNVDEIIFHLLDSSQWQEGDEVEITFSHFRPNGWKNDISLVVDNSLYLKKMATPLTFEYTINGVANSQTSDVVTITIKENIETIGFSKDDLKKVLSRKIKMKNERTGNVSILTNIFNVTDITDNLYQIVAILPDSSFKEGDIASFFIDLIQEPISLNIFSFTSLTSFVTLHKIPESIYFQFKVNGKANTEPTTQIEIEFTTSPFGVDANLFAEKIEVKNLRTNGNLSINNPVFQGNKLILNLSNPSQWQEGDKIDVSISFVNYDGVIYQFFPLTLELILHNK